MQRLGPLLTVLTLLTLAGAAWLGPATERVEQPVGWLARIAPAWTAGYAAVFEAMTEQPEPPEAESVTCEGAYSRAEWGVTGGCRGRVVVVRCCSEIGS